MIKEYDRISTAYFSLRAQVNEWIKIYITLIGLPLTVLAVVLNKGIGSTDINLNNIPIIVSALLFMVSILGFFVTLSIISIRMQMILYARTINGVRRFFAELDQGSSPRTHPSELVNYLILPISDTVPSFYEVGRGMFIQVIMLGFIDGLIFVVAIQNLFFFGWGWSILIGLVFAVLHFVIYFRTACQREKQWKTRFADNLEIPNKKFLC